MSVGYTPTSNVTTFQPPSHVIDHKLLRSSVSPLGKVQLAFTEKEVIDLTGEEEEPEIIDLTLDDDTEMVINSGETTPEEGFSKWIATTFSEGGLVIERTNNGIKQRVTTPYYPRRSVVSINAPIKRGTFNKRIIANECPDV